MEKNNKGQELEQELEVQLILYHLYMYSLKTENSYHYLVTLRAFGFRAIYVHVIL